VCAAGFWRGALAALASIELVSLSELRLALPNRSFGIRQLLDQALAAAGVELNSVFVTGSVEALRSYARSGDELGCERRSTAQKTMGRRTERGADRVPSRV